MISFFRYAGGGVGGEGSVLVLECVLLLLRGRRKRQNQRLATMRMTTTGTTTPMATWALSRRLPLLKLFEEPEVVWFDGDVEEDVAVAVGCVNDDRVVVRNECIEDDG